MATAEISHETSSSCVVSTALVIATSTTTSTSMSVDSEPEGNESTTTMIFEVPPPSTSSQENSTPPIMLASPKKLFEPYIPRRSESVSITTSSEQQQQQPPPKIGQKRSHSQAEFKNLPRFTANAPENGSLPAPSARIPSSPSPKNDIIAIRISRPNSPSNANRIVLPRSRVANIRRESDCSLESEVAHERYIKTAVQVSTGFEDFSLDDKPAEDRKRAKSITDPISITILGPSFAQTSSQSPTRPNVDQAKQCYSPATQQLVRSNISYSPSPSPTPSSPKRSRVMRSMSPIVTRQISKRRYTNSGNCSGLDSDNEGPPLSSKRQCTSFSKSSGGCGSPLVREMQPTTMFYNSSINAFSNGCLESESSLLLNGELQLQQQQNNNNNNVRAFSPLSECSSTTSSCITNSSSTTTNNFFKPSSSSSRKSHSYSYSNLSNSATVDSDESGSMIANDDSEILLHQLQVDITTTINNNNKNNNINNDGDQSSTAFSSRACTPIDEIIMDNNGGSSSNGRLPDEGPVQCTTPTGLIRTLTPGSSSPFTNRFLLPPSPLASQRLRDASDY